VSSAEANQSASDHQPFGLLVVAVAVSLAVGVLLLLSSNSVLAIASGAVYLVALLLLLSPEVVGVDSERAGRVPAP
jgi:hypothetical protein